MLRLAGEIADGGGAVACPRPYVKDVVTREVATGRARAGQGLDGFDMLRRHPERRRRRSRRRLPRHTAELHRYFGLPLLR